LSRTKKVINLQEEDIMATQKAQQGIQQAQQQQAQQAAQAAQQQAQQAMSQTVLHNVLINMKGKEFVSLRELSEAAARVIPYFAQEQSRYKVAVFPDDRTLRHYVKEGMVDKPIRYEGASGVYRYKHLLQTVAVKYLQTGYLSLPKIKNMLQGLNEKDLERILCGDLSELSFQAQPPPQPDRSLMAAREKPIEDWVKVAVDDDVQLYVRDGALENMSKERKKEVLTNLAGNIRKLIVTYINEERQRKVTGETEKR
jgi:DNA-binding transcriptional MerR regulator